MQYNIYNLYTKFRSIAKLTKFDIENYCYSWYI